MRTIIIFILLLLFGCVKDFEYEKEIHPVIKTYPVKDFTQTHVEFKGEVLFLGEEPIIDHGFKLSFFTNIFINPIDSLTICLGEINNEGVFTGKINQDLLTNQTYYMRAYAFTENIKVYGYAVEFQKKQK